MLNEVFILGHITKDPELKYLPSGSAHTGFVVALNHKYKSGNETKEEVSFIVVSVFGKMAENCAEYLHKGSKVLVKGRLKQETWEGKDGTRREKIKVIASLVQFLDGKKADGKQAPDSASSAEEDEIPF